MADSYVIEFHHQGGYKAVTTDGVLHFPDDAELRALKSSNKYREAYHIRCKSTGLRPNVKAPLMYHHLFALVPGVIGGTLGRYAGSKIYLAIDPNASETEMIVATNTGTYVGAGLGQAVGEYAFVGRTAASALTTSFGFALPVAMAICATEVYVSWANEAMDLYDQVDRQNYEEYRRQWQWAIKNLATVVPLMSPYEVITEAEWNQSMRTIDNKINHYHSQGLVTQWRVWCLTKILYRDLRHGKGLATINYLASQNYEKPPDRPYWWERGLLKHVWEKETWTDAHTWLNWFLERL